MGRKVDHHQYSPRLGNRQCEVGAHLAIDQKIQTLLRPRKCAPKVQKQFMQKCFHILVLLRRAISAIPGAAGMLSSLHRALKTAEGQQVLITTQVQKRTKPVAALYSLPGQEAHPLK